MLTRNIKHTQQLLFIYLFTYEATYIHTCIYTYVYNWRKRGHEFEKEWIQGSGRGWKGKNESINIFQVSERLGDQKELEGAKRRDKHCGLMYEILRKWLMKVREETRQISETEAYSKKISRATLFLRQQCIWGNNDTGGKESKGVK